MSSAETHLFFEGLASRWDEGFTPQQYGRLRQIFDEHIPALEQPVLDVGSGTGILVPYLRDKLHSKGRIIELDIAAQMLRKARQKLSNTEDMHFIRGEAQYLPFTGASLGTVFCFQVIPHIEDKKALLREVRRVLRPDGLFVVLHLANHHRLNALHSHLGAPVHSHRMYPAGHLADMIVTCGFSVLQVREEEGLYLIHSRAPHTGSL